jgi:hypothetical protein
MTDFTIPEEAVGAAFIAARAASASASDLDDVSIGAMTAAIAAALSATFEELGFARTKTLDEINTPPFYGSDVYISVAEQTIWPSVPVYRIKEPK